MKLPKPQPAIRTDEDTIALIGRLAAHYDDGKIAGILNRQGRRPATVGGVRRYRHIPRHDPANDPVDGELVTIEKAAETLGLFPPRSTGGSRSGSSPASKTPPARHGGSASTTSCAPGSPRTRHPAG